ncbi:hypothetical protein Fmac_025142 [Flemingia macrophylla]|uniref:Uncharacterized protein n=1 Tax=Flemingia macrophylla TaxID=520843 RepID=A0ABD1LRE3_9FABA
MVLVDIQASVTDRCLLSSDHEKYFMVEKISQDNLISFKEIREKSPEKWPLERPIYRIRSLALGRQALLDVVAGAPSPFRRCRQGSVKDELTRLVAQSQGVLLEYRDRDGIPNEYRDEDGFYQTRIRPTPLHPYSKVIQIMFRNLLPNRALGIFFCTGFLYSLLHPIHNILRFPPICPSHQQQCKRFSQPQQPSQAMVKLLFLSAGDEVQTLGTWHDRLHKWREILRKERFVEQLNSLNAKHVVEFDMKEVENSLRKDVAEKATRSSPKDETIFVETNLKKSVLQTLKR